MGGCASSKPKVKDEDREPYGGSATSGSASRKKSKGSSSGEGDQSKSKAAQSGVCTSPDSGLSKKVDEQGSIPVAAVYQEENNKPEIVSVDTRQEVKNEDKKPEQTVVRPSSEALTNALPSKTGAPTVQTAHSEMAPSSDNIASIRPSAGAVQQQPAGKFDSNVAGAAAAGHHVVAPSQVDVRLSATGTVKQPSSQQQLEKPTLASSLLSSVQTSRSALEKPDGAEKQIGKEIDKIIGPSVRADAEPVRVGGLANGHVESKSPSTLSTSTIVVDGKREGFSADERRLSFASSSKAAVEATVSLSGDVSDERVDIKPIDPKMEIFDALNASAKTKPITQATDAVPAAVAKSPSLVADDKNARNGEVISTPAHPAPRVELRNEIATTEEQAAKITIGVTLNASTVNSQTSTTSEQRENKPTMSLTSPSTTLAATPKEQDISVSAAVTTSSTKTVIQGQSTPSAVSSPPSTSSLPRPLTSLGTSRSVSIASPIASSTASSITSPTASPRDGCESQQITEVKHPVEKGGDSAHTKAIVEKTSDRATAEISTKDEPTPAPAKQPSTERTSRLPTFSPTGVPSSAVISGTTVTPKTASESVSTSTGGTATVVTTTPTTPKATSTPSSIGRERKSSAAAAATYTASSVAPPVSSEDLDRIKELLIDLSAENRSVSSMHQLAANTRTKILQTVDQWLTKNGKTADETKTSNETTPTETANRKSSKCRVLIVTGQPGAGKTCLAAELCRRYSSRNILTGSHFFDRRSSGIDHNHAVAALMSLACSLVESQLPGYVTSLPSYAKLSKAAAANDVVELFSLLVSQPLRSVDAQRSSSLGDTATACRVVVIDGLDECNPADHDQLCQLINEFDTSTPDWLHLVATVRSDDQLTPKLATERVRTVELRADAADPDCIGDVKRFMRDSMSKYIDRISLDGALTQLAKNTGGNFLCAKLLKIRLDAMPPDTKLALRDISLTFPVGFSEVCRQTFQTLHERLLAATDKNRNKNRPTAYATVTSLLAIARAPLHRSAFGVENEAAVVQTTSGGVLTMSVDGMIALSHDAVAEWLLSEQTAAPLAVNLINARQVMAETIVGWLRPVLAEEGDDDEGSLPAPGDGIHPSLTEYAAKHALHHLTEATRQQENIAKALCSLKFVEYKLKIPGVKLEHVLADYNHSHVQTGPASSSPKLVTLESYMKRNVDLVEQISMMHRFIVRRGPRIVSVGPALTLHVAANYPTATRIQQNARLDIGDVPWFEDLLANADSKSIDRSLSGTIVDVDLSTDQKLVAVVTSRDSGQPLLYIFNAVTMEPATPEPVDLRAVLPDFKGSGLFARFIPAGTTPSVFIGSLTQFVSARGGRPIESGFDLASVKLTERYLIECCAVGGSLLACAVNTLPFGGRSLHVILFDVITKKCTRTVEVLKFRFGGSAQYGVKACALSADGSMLCACVKQSNRAELKVMVWSTSKGDMISSVDVVDDSLSKCCIFTGEQPSVIITSGVRLLADKERHGCLSNKSYAWSYLDKESSRAIQLDHGTKRSVGHAHGQTAAWAQWRDIGTSSELVLSIYKRGAVAFETGGSVTPDRKFIVYGLDEVAEVFPLDKSVLFLSKNSVHLLQHQHLQVVDVSSTSSVSASFVAGDARIESVCFMSRSDDPLVSFSSFSSHSIADDQNVSLTTVSLSAKSEGIAVVSKLFDRAPSASVTLTDLPDTSVFLAPEVVACSTDSSAALMRCRDSVQAVDITSGMRRSLPHFSDLNVGKTSSTTANDDAIKLCVVSSKDSLIGIVYTKAPQSIYLFDVKTPQTGRPLQHLRTQSEDADSVNVNAVTDFSFLPANGHVIACHRKSNDDSETLTIWNQRSGTLVSTECGLHIGFVRASMASDRFVVGLRSPTGGTLLLRNNDNHFNKSLETTVIWSPEMSSTDVEFSVDGTVVIGISGGQQCCVWNAGNGEILRSFTLVGASEIVGMLTNAHALLHDPKGERLLLVDITLGLESPPIVAAASTDGRLCRKWTGRRLRISPRGGAIAGVTERRELRLYTCHNMSSVKRQTTLQIMKSSSASK